MTPFLAVALAAAAPAPATAPAVVGGLAPMLKRAIPLDAALAEFDRLCLVRPFDAAAFEAGIRSSTWKYRRNPGTDPGLTGYDSTRGYVSIKHLGTPAGRLPQCNFDGATTQAYGDGALAGKVEARLAARGLAASRRQAGPNLLWEWPAETGKVVRLYLMRHPGSDPRQLTLTLQKWPAELTR